MCIICKATYDDLQEILQLQYLAYQTEAALFGNKEIPPLKQTLDEVVEEFNSGIILKMIDENNRIIGSVRANELDGTVYIGKLMVHPDYRRRGFASRLMTEIENHFPNKRYELFTSTRSIDNIRLYTRLGYKIFDSKVIDDELEFVFMEKVCN
ncbi:MAG: GNAT family N-acetyltransferase [Ruminococcus sp.]|nr:GNAT family N-acetyltransferase [Ruminococcus sp.]